MGEFNLILLLVLTLREGFITEKQICSMVFKFLGSVLASIHGFVSEWLGRPKSFQVTMAMLMASYDVV